MAGQCGVAAMCTWSHHVINMWRISLSGFLENVCALVRLSRKHVEQPKAGHVLNMLLEKYGFIWVSIAVNNVGLVPSSSFWFLGPLLISCSPAAIPRSETFGLLKACRGHVGGKDVCYRMILEKYPKVPPACLHCLGVCCTWPLHVTRHDCALSTEQFLLNSTYQKYRCKGVTKIESTHFAAQSVLILFL